jgi:hypothetical protein
MPLHAARSGSSCPPNLRSTTKRVYVYDTAFGVYQTLSMGSTCGIESTLQGVLHPKQSVRELQYDVSLLLQVLPACSPPHVPACKLCCRLGSLPHRMFTLPWRLSSIAKW